VVVVKRPLLVATSTINRRLDSRTIFHARIAALRRNHNQSLQQVADAMSMSKAHMLEKGRS
jgi:hypothetical protein